MPHRVHDDSELARHRGDRPLVARTPNEHRSPRRRRADDAQNAGGLASNSGAAGTGSLGSALGSGIFLQGAETITLAPAAGNLLAIGDTVTDQGANGGIGQRALQMQGAGTVALDGNVALSGGLVLAAGTVEIGAGTAAGTVAFAAGSVAFAGSAALVVGDPASATPLRAGFVTPVPGFGIGDTIDLAGVVRGGVSFTNGTVSAGTAGTFAVGLAADLSASALVISADAAGTGTDLTALCFCAGTHIATPDGDVALEHLHIGDAVLTLGGVARRIVWSGFARRRLVSGRRSGASSVIAREGALGPGVPRRDLRLSRGHSLLQDGALIPVEFLINHRSILWDEAARAVSLYHLEPDGHDVLLAEGAPAESYRDDGNRVLLAARAARPDRPAPPPYAPVLTGGALVDAVWRRLRERAGAPPPPALTDDPDLRLRADGRPVAGSWIGRDLFTARLARPPRELVITSGAAARDAGTGAAAAPAGARGWVAGPGLPRVLARISHRK